MSFIDNFDFDFLQPSAAVQPADNTDTNDMGTMPDFDQPLDFSHAPAFESTDPVVFFIDDLAEFGNVPFDAGGTGITAGETYMQAGVSVYMPDMQAEPPGSQAMDPNADEAFEDDQFGDYCGETESPDPPDILGEMGGAEIDSLARKLVVSMAENQTHSAPAPAPAATQDISQLGGLQFPTPAPPPVTNTHPNTGASMGPGRGAYSSPGQIIAPAAPTHSVASFADSQRPRLPPMPAPPKPKKISPKEVSRNTKARLAAYIASGKWADAIAAHRSKTNSAHVSQASVDPVAPQPVRAQSQPSSSSEPLGYPVYRPVVQPAAPAKTEHEPGSDPARFCHHCGVQQLIRPLTPRSRTASLQKDYKVTKPVTPVTPPKQKQAAKKKRVFAYEGMKVPQQVEELAVVRDASGPVQGQVDHSSHLVEQYPESGCRIHRIRYTRANIEEFLSGFDEFVFYERNENFSVEAPYQQEITRIIVDPNTLEAMMGTRAGLCPYCEELHFYELRNSCYAQHMSHSHGIHTNNSLTPDPVAVGKYLVAKPDHSSRETMPQARQRDCAVCPECNDLVEIKCWKSTSETKPLANYLRHYKDKHSGEKNKDTSTSCDESE